MEAGTVLSLVVPLNGHSGASATCVPTGPFVSLVSFCRFFLLKNRTEGNEGNEEESEGYQETWIAILRFGFRMRSFHRVTKIMQSMLQSQAKL